MRLIVNKTFKLRGKATPPSSKSESIRGLLFALLAEGISTLHNMLISDDTKAALGVCRAFGANLALNDQTLIIKSNGLPLINTNHIINTGNSGITTLFSLPILGLRANHTTPVILNCDEQMKSRPVKSLIDALRLLGMQITYMDIENQLPVNITGQLQGGMVEVDGITSQYLSALLISLPCAQRDSVVIVKKLKERSYVNMTLDYLKKQRIDYNHEQMGNIDRFYIRGKQKYSPINTRVNGDYSSASCLIAAAVLHAGEVELKGLNSNDTQGDKELIPILQKMGADIHIENDHIRITGYHQLKGISIDANDIPDLVPALSVIATQATGKTVIFNVQQARIKETDRIHSMTEGLKRMGARIEASDDGITIYKSDLSGSIVNGYDDHRTVMALTIAGTIASGTTTITDGHTVNKTFPDFVNTIRSLGVDVTVSDNVADKHILLIGFKHVGKTQIGREMAKVLKKSFIDLDREVERLYESTYKVSLPCRQIMKHLGEEKYRELESQTLKKVIKYESCVISLGGGTIVNKNNHDLIKKHTLIHVVASRGIVFERIMIEGRPAFFDINEDPYESFNRLWDEREVIYTSLTTRIVDNSGSIEQAVQQAISYI